MDALIPVVLTINGRRYELAVEPRTLLVYAIREEAGLTGTHVACDTSGCGACTVLVDGHAVKSCTMLAVQAEDTHITTIEGLRTSDALHPMQEAFRAYHGLQCGYCTSGMIMCAVDIITNAPSPTEHQIRHGLEGNICRCTGYENIVKAVSAAAIASFPQ